MSASITSLKSDITSRLDEMDRKIGSISNMQNSIAALEKSMTFHTQELDTMRNSTLPGLVGHISQVATAITLQNVDLNVHRRKFSLIIQGLEGPAREECANTRKSVIDMAKTKLGVLATPRDLAACHRLKPMKDAGIIVRRFVDINERD